MTQTYDLQTMALFSVGLLNVAAALVSGVLVWRGRHDMPDRSRTFLALSLFLCVAVYVHKMVRLLTDPSTALLVEAIPPVVVFTAVFPQLLMLFYPLEVIKPGWLNWQSAELILLPYALLTLPALLVPPDANLIEHVDGSLSAELTDSLGQPQGQIEYRQVAGEQDGAVAVVDMPEALDDLCTQLRFIPSDLWPNNATMDYSKYKLGDLVLYEKNKRTTVEQTNGTWTDTYIHCMKCITTLDSDNEVRTYFELNKVYAGAYYKFLGVIWDSDYKRLGAVSIRVKYFK